jgi:hypothetical protein
MVKNWELPNQVGMAKKAWYLSMDYPEVIIKIITNFINDNMGMLIYIGWMKISGYNIQSVITTVKMFLKIKNLYVQRI